jgi:hypothetical protein
LASAIHGVISLLFAFDTHAPVDWYLCNTQYLSLFAAVPGLLPFRNVIVIPPMADSLVGLDAQ